MTSLPRSTPSAQGVAAGGVVQFLDAVERAGIEMHSLMVLVGGEVVVQGWWAPYSSKRRHLLYSLSKSFTSMAVGLAIEEGAFSVDDRVVDLLPDLVPANVHERVERIRVRHVLSMATGHETDAIGPASALLEADDPDLVRAFLTLAPEREPGTLFTYNQLATHTAARLVEEHAGTRLLEYLRPRLLEPLGVADPAWSSIGGRDLGFSGLHLPTEGVAALGQLLLRGGRWGGRQLVPAEWIEQATRLQQRNDPPEFNFQPVGPNASPDWSAGYGYQFWMGRHGFRGDGAYGQFCLVWPPQDAVVVMTACTEAMDVELELAYRHLLPAVAGAGAVDADADAALAARLESLSVPPPADAGGRIGGRFERVDRQYAAVTVRGVALTPFDGGWTCHLTGGVGADLTASGAGALEGLPVGRGRWLEGAWPGAQVPFVSAGGVGADGVWEAHLRMIETPHHLILQADPASATCTLRWDTVPLHGSDPAAHAVAQVTRPAR